MLAAVGLTIAATALAGIALGDTLELKSGEIVQGKFLGGSPLNIRFQVDGKEQIFATRDVLNIGFSEAAVESSIAPTRPATAPPAPATPAAPAAAAVAATPAAQPLSAPIATTTPAPRSSPATRAITIPSGTSVFVRMIDGVDSSTNTVGDRFRGSLETALTVGNTVVAPKGSDVFGRLAQAKEAGKISGSAQLTLELTGIRINGNIVPVESTEYDVAGKGRGKQSAERIGGAAIAGAVIGGIVGGGKGAAVGATVGAGGGTAVQVMTHGDQVRIPSETLLEFKLQQDVTAPVASNEN